MKVVCPKNAEHQKFSVRAHVAEDWIVDAQGNFLESKGCTDTVHHPDSSDYYQCADCGTDAKVTS